MQDHTRKAIDELRLEPDRPLVVVDADEVLVHFATHFRDWLAGRGVGFDLKEYRFDHAGFDIATGEPVSVESLYEHLHDFIAKETAFQPMVPKASMGLNLLASSANVVILSNVPKYAVSSRRINLDGHAMPYPLVANEGSKGPALAELQRRSGGPVVFIDDSPHQIAQSALHAPDIARVHFTGCDLVASVLPVVKEAQHRPGDWDQVVEIVEEILS